MTRPNILYIHCHDAGRCIQPYGYPVSTPNVQRLAEEGVLAVPGTGFGRSGYIRLSLTIPLERIEKSIGGFERAFLSSRGNIQG